jgi:uncharacterized protein (TIGR02145 family)
MEKFMRFTFAVALVMMGAIFHSCQEESEIPAVESMVKNHHLIAPDCNQHCLEPGGPFVEKMYQEVVGWGGPTGAKFSKTVDLVVYNTLDHFVLKLKSTESMNDVIIKFPDAEAYSVKNFQGTYPANTWALIYLDLPAQWEACDLFTFELTIAGKGPAAKFSVEYNLYSQCLMSVTDIDQNVYPVVKIGEQYWMAKNLAVTRYRNGDLIPTDLSYPEWINTTEGAQVVYQRFHLEWDDIDNVDDILKMYGRLYNWYAVDDSRGLCPAGWHVPGDAEWTQLTDYLISNYPYIDASNISLKLRATFGWGSEKEDFTFNGTDDFGFAALPGGQRTPDFAYYWDRIFAGFWWTSTYESSHPMFGGSAWYRSIHAFSGTITRDDWYVATGMSVRCIKD